MQVEIRAYTEVLGNEWDDFVENGSLNGTFLHTRKFYSHNRLNAGDDNSYLFYKKNKIIGVIPFNKIVSGQITILYSYLRATYGGFIVSRDAGVDEILAMVELTVSEAKKNELAEIIIRNPFRIFNSNFCDESDYAMWFHGFSVKYRELEIAIRLGNKTDVEKNYSDATARNIKKGKKELVAAESIEFEKYWKVLENNLSEKHAAAPTHNYSDFCALLKSVGQDKVKLFVAKLNGEIIAGVVVFLVNKMALHAQYIASDIRYQELRPLNVVIDHIIEFGCAQQYKFLNLGMANENNGRGINHGLFRFKEGFGGRGVLRETMHLQLKNIPLG